MTLAAELAPDALIGRLRAQAEAPSLARVSTLIPVPAPVAAVLPEPGLKPGMAYCLDSAGALLSALLATPSGEGCWCAVIGIPEFGAEAAQRAGVSLERLVLVPEPAEQWLTVTAALAEAIPVLALRPQGRVSERDAGRLAARLRERGGVLLVHGEWPRAAARLAVAEQRWHGLGQGHGHLDSREVTLTGSSRRYPLPRRARVLLPTATGALATAAPVPEQRTPLRVAG